VQTRAIFAVACVLAAAALGAAYSNHFDNGFHFDDSHVIVNNLAIRSLHDWPSFFTDVQTFTARPQNAVYRPLLTLSYAVDHALAGGLEPRQFHRTQFALILLLGGLLTVFFRQVYEQVDPSPWTRWAALGAATLFCIHTANTETVNYLSSRSSVVATLGVTASFCVWLAWPRLRRTQLYLVPMCLGALAKLLAVMFAPLLFAFVLLVDERRSSPARAVRTAFLQSLPAFVAGGVLYVFLRSMEASELEYAGVDRLTYLRTQPLVWAHYLRLFLWPRGLTADPDWGWVESWTDPRLMGGMAFLVVLAGAALWLTRLPRGRPAAFGLAWFAIALLPTSSVFPLSEVYNEHRIFFPYVGLACALAWGLGLGFSRLGRVRGGAGAALLALAVLTAHGVGTHRRNEVWASGASLWGDVAVKSPRNGRGLMNYGLTLMRDGKLQEALDYYERAAVFTPNYSILEINLGVVKSALGDPQAAEPHFRRALELTPGYARGHYFYARWLIEHERAPQARWHLERAIELSPGDIEANRMLLDLHAARGDREALDRLVRRVLEIAPADPAATAYDSGGVPWPVREESAESYSSLGMAKLQRRAWLEAAALYRHVLALEPDSSPYWNNLGWALGSAGYYDLAIPCFERAMELDPDSRHARNNLDWVRERQSIAAGSP
jgi:tetratricopeptide (TPR) repeat protein